MTMQGLVTVFGGSGFIGRYVVRALAKRGWRVRVAVREPHIAPELKVMGDVGQVELVQANVRNLPSIERALDGAVAVVNLVGVLYEVGNQKFQSVHAEAPGIIAAAARARGITQFVQVSAIGADAASPSRYARTKAAGEQAVLSVLKSATIVRPSVAFGPEDDFFNRFAGMAAMAPALPLIGGGHTKFQPVYAGDIAAAIAAILETPGSAGRTYELGGPGVYTFRQILEMILKETLRRRALVPLSFGMARLIGIGGDIAAWTGMIKPPLTTDQVENLRADNTVSPRAKGLADLGVVPTAVEAVIPTYLWRFRKGGQFAVAEAANALN